MESAWPIDSEVFSERWRLLILGWLASADDLFAVFATGFATVIAALFVRRDSIYKTMPGVDAWDEDRDARKWPGGSPVVAHPPCAQWGALGHMAKRNPAEKRLAILALRFVRKWGGVLEHPRRSKLWPTAKLPTGTEPDKFGGWTLPVSQQWWGHKAEKQTLLYIVGVKPADIPPLPYVMGRAQYICAGGAASTAENAKRRRQCLPEFRRPSVTHSEREHTPPAFAQWLVDLARSADSGI